MKYNFDQIYNRKKTDCYKWDLIPTVFGREDVIPMWVADMDLPAAQPVVDALIKRAEHPFYGYTHPGSCVVDSVVERLERKFNWEIEPEWVVFIPGVVPALHTAIRSLTRPGDGVILQEPAYHPFFPSITGSGCQIVNNNLRLTGGRYHQDYQDLEEKFQPKKGRLRAPPRIKTILFCNPHNPVGRLWNVEEITRVGEIAIDNGATIISDEIHCELLFKGYKHIPFATISEEFEQNSITCMAPTKTFNIPGLSVSNIIIPNKKLRNNFKEIQSGIVPEPNLFGFTALEAAYRYGDEWLDQALDYLQGNLDFLTDYLKEKIPDIKVIEPQGTYLIWLDCRGLGMDKYALGSFMCNEAKVGLEDGFIFGEAGSGFMRMNIACPRSILEEALKRIESAVNSLKTPGK
ncbi:MAG TPA: MalY/PatB family protein [Methanobacterium sp.]